jgi:hypothetical protein
VRFFDRQEIFRRFTNIAAVLSSLRNVRGDNRRKTPETRTRPKPLPKGNAMNKLTRTVAVAATFAAAAVATSANASTYQNLDSLVATTTSGGQVIIALDIECRGGGNFTMQTDRRTNEMYRGCAYRDGGRVLIRWNDGSAVSYTPNDFSRMSSWMRI